MVTDFDSKISLSSVDDNVGDWTYALVGGDYGDGPKLLCLFEMKTKLQEQNSDHKVSSAALFFILSYVSKIQKCNSR